MHVVDSSPTARSGPSTAQRARPAVPRKDTGFSCFCPEEPRVLGPSCPSVWLSGNLENWTFAGLPALLVFSTELSPETETGGGGSHLAPGGREHYSSPGGCEARAVAVSRSCQHLHQTCALGGGGRHLGTNHRHRLNPSLLERTFNLTKCLHVGISQLPVL